MASSIFSRRAGEILEDWLVVAGEKSAEVEELGIMRRLTIEPKREALGKRKIVKST
jgi:hypothetical protein